eukprot:jgi/Tetstr1/443516/TSEL_031520.t1
MIDFACVSSTTPTWSNDPRWCTPGIAATEAEHGKLAADRASSAPVQGVHRGTTYPVVVEDRGRLGKSALTVVYIFSLAMRSMDETSRGSSDDDPPLTIRSHHRDRHKHDRSDSAPTDLAAALIGGHTDVSFEREGTLGGFSHGVPLSDSLVALGTWLDARQRGDTLRYDRMGPVGFWLLEQVQPPPALLGEAQPWWGKVFGSPASPSIERFVSAGDPELPQLCADRRRPLPVERLPLRLPAHIYQSLFLTQETCNHRSLASGLWEVVDPLGPEWDQICPALEPRMASVMPSQTRHASCAVVGNAGNLAWSRYGAEIDRHEAVFRLNKTKMVVMVIVLAMMMAWVMVVVIMPVVGVVAEAVVVEAVVVMAMVAIVVVVAVVLLAVVMVAAATAAVVAMAVVVMAVVVEAVAMIITLAMVLVMTVVVMALVMMMARVMVAVILPVVEAVVVIMTVVVMAMIMTLTTVLVVAMVMTLSMMMAWVMVAVILPVVEAAAATAVVEAAVVVVILPVLMAVVMVAAAAVVVILMVVVMAAVVEAVAKIITFDDGVGDDDGGGGGGNDDGTGHGGGDNDGGGDVVAMMMTSRMVMVVVAMVVVVMAAMVVLMGLMMVMIMALVEAVLVITVVAPTTGFEEQVGTNTTYRYMNGDQFSVYAAEGWDSETGEMQRLPVHMGGIIIVSYSSPATMAKELPRVREHHPDEKLTTASYYLHRYTNFVLNQFRQCANMRNEGRSFSRTKATSGIKALLAALHMCKHVSVYGIGDTSPAAAAMPYQYFAMGDGNWTSRGMVSELHSLTLEEQLLQALAHAGLIRHCQLSGCTHPLKT